MPRQPSAPAGDRIFARIDRFDCECPACGELIRAAYTPRTQRGKIRDELAHAAAQGTAHGKRHNTATSYNAVTSTLRCPHCFRQYQVGLLLWPLKRGRQRYEVPADQRPTEQQARRLRQYTTGIYVFGTQKLRIDPTNVYVIDGCTCPVEEGGWAPGCPVHGWERVKQEMAEAAAQSESEAENGEAVPASESEPEE